MYQAAIKTNYFLIFILILFSGTKLFAQMEYVKSIKKIDVHIPLTKDAAYLRKFMDDYNMKMVNICYNGHDINSQIKASKEFTKNYPRYYAWVTTFDLKNRDNPGWLENVIKRLKQDFNDGAIGVKIWKDVGLILKNTDGKFLQIDDPVFEPIFEFLVAENKPVYVHVAEPIQAWMPPQPGSYWDRHPEYSFYDKPEFPSYSEIIARRDRVLAKFPKLKFIGGHLGSTSFDVDELSKRFDKYPNFAVELGGRAKYLMWQARGRVRAFFIKYQDRIMYGTDVVSGPINYEGVEKTAEEIKENLIKLQKRNDLFFRYFASKDDIHWSDIIYSDAPVGEATYTVKGLDLPKEVLDKVFYINAVKWFPGVDKGF